jgi:hypothetical protein
MSWLETDHLPADLQGHCRQQDGIIIGASADPGKLMRLFLPGSLQQIRKLLSKRRA